MGLISNIRNRGFKDILSPKHWWFFIKSKFVLNWEEKQARAEQIIFRQSLCGRCFKAGECIGEEEYVGEENEQRCKGCGCPSPELFHEKQMVCACGKWNEMMKAKEWNIYKKEIGLEIKVSYK